MNTQSAADLALFYAECADARAAVHTGTPTEFLSLNNGASFLRHFAQTIVKTIELGPIKLVHPEAFDALEAADRALTGQAAGKAAFPKEWIVSIGLALL
ncbi:hypothetical protein [Kitasatospora sp. NPDC085464]|uniref:hypothetical protein n=1 Tax=Kitasatospora sp. NPDC085464 TaxID=3364063 RepID=UPI0037C8189A